MKVHIELISDFICPWCYIGKARMTRVAELLKGEIELDIDIKPFILYPHIPAGGLPKADFAKKTKSGMGGALKAAAKEEQIEIKYRNIERIPYSMEAHRLTWMIEDKQQRFDVSKQIFHDYFELGMDIEDHQYLFMVADDYGVEPEISARLSDPTAALDEVQSYIDDVRNQGISLVPTLKFGPQINLPSLQPIDVWVNYIRRAARMQNMNS